MNKGIISVDKARIDTNKATNRSAIASLIASIGLLISSLHDGNFSIEMVLTAAIGVFSSFAQWLQGEPSRDTRLIKQILGIEGRTNYDVLRNAIDRIVRGVGDRAVSDGRSDVLSDYGRGRRVVVPPSAETIAIRQWREDNERSFKAIADDEDPITQG